MYVMTDDRVVLIRETKVSQWSSPRGLPMLMDFSSQD